MAKYKKPPARIRYEQSHPTVSFHLDLETKKRLETALEGQSFASFIKEALGVKEKKITDLKKERQKAYIQGHTAAENQFKVTYNCNICGKSIAINAENEKKAAKKYMEENRWARDDCIEKVKQRYGGLRTT